LQIKSCGKMKNLLCVFRNCVLNYLVVFRNFYWKLFFRKIGKNVRFYGSIKALRPENIIIGNNCTLNDYIVLNARAEILIGNNVTISSGVIVNTAGLNYLNKKEHFAKRIEIMDDVWIGSNALLLPGVTIGERTIIGAGSVVNKSIPSNSLAVGVPAKVIKIFAF